MLSDIAAMARIMDARRRRDATGGGDHACRTRP
jgi:hypothetical protein